MRLNVKPVTLRYHDTNNDEYYNITSYFADTVEFRQNMAKCVETGIPTDYFAQKCAICRSPNDFHAEAMDISTVLYVKMTRPDESGLRRVFHAIDHGANPSHITKCQLLLKTAATNNLLLPHHPCLKPVKEDGPLRFKIMTALDLTDSTGFSAQHGFDDFFIQTTNCPINSLTLIVTNDSTRTVDLSLVSLRCPNQGSLSPINREVAACAEASFSIADMDRGEILASDVISIGGGKEKKQKRNNKQSCCKLLPHESRRYNITYGLRGEQREEAIIVPVFLSRHSGNSEVLFNSVNVRIENVQLIPMNRFHSFMVDFRDNVRSGACQLGRAALTTGYRSLGQLREDLSVDFWKGRVVGTPKITKPTPEIDSTFIEDRRSLHKDYRTPQIYIDMFRNFNSHVDTREGREWLACTYEQPLRAVTSDTTVDNYFSKLTYTAFMEYLQQLLSDGWSQVFYVTTTQDGCLVVQASDAESLKLRKSPQVMVMKANDYTRYMNGEQRSVVYIAAVLRPDKPEVDNDGYSLITDPEFVERVSLPSKIPVIIRSYPRFGIESHVAQAFDVGYWPQYIDDDNENHVSIRQYAESENESTIERAPKGIPKIDLRTHQGELCKRMLGLYVDVTNFPDARFADFIRYCQRIFIAGGEPEMKVADAARELIRKFSRAIDTFLFDEQPDERCMVIKCIHPLIAARDIDHRQKLLDVFVHRHHSHSDAISLMAAGNGKTLDTAEVIIWCLILKYCAESALQKMENGDRVPIFGRTESLCFITLAPVLVFVQSNNAGNVLALRILEEYADLFDTILDHRSVLRLLSVTQVAKHFDAIEQLKMGDRSNQADILSDSLLSISNLQYYENEEGESKPFVWFPSCRSNPTMAEPPQITRQGCIIMTVATGIMRFYTAAFDKVIEPFMVVFEEYSQISPEQAYFIRALFPSSPYWIIGDHLQLGPTTNAEACKAEQLTFFRAKFGEPSNEPFAVDSWAPASTTSVLMFKNASIDPRMNQLKSLLNFRSPPAIIALQRKLYGDMHCARRQPMAIAGLDVLLPTLHNNDFVVFEVPADDTKLVTSYFSVAQTSAALRLISLLHDSCSVPLHTISVMSPYLAEVSDIKLANATHYGTSAIKITSCTSSQGQENDFVIIVLARPCKNGKDLTTRIGFLAQHRLIYVSLTRSRNKTIIISDEDVWKQAPFIAEVVNGAVFNGEEVAKITAQQVTISHAVLTEGNLDRSMVDYAKHHLQTKQARYN